MKITKIELFPITLAYKKKKPFIMGGFARTATNGVLIKIHTDEGITGIAESGNCTHWYIGESQGSVMGMIADVFAPKILLGENPFNIEKIVARMDSAAMFSSMSKAIVDYALHDIVGKKLGVPVYQLLGGLSVEKVPLHFVLSSGTPEDVVDQAVEVRKAGYKNLKLKAAQGTLDEELAILKAMRDALGYDVNISIDANGCWTYYQALVALKKMDKYNLVYAEQPVPWWDVDSLARLRGKVGTPIFADESVVEPRDMLEVIAKNAADGVFIKVTKAGGLLKMQKVVAVAKAAGLPVMCGCFNGSGLEAAPTAHFTAANEWASQMDHGNLGPITIADVLDTVTTPITDDLAINVPKYEKGYIYPPTGPGLGIELNEEVLKKSITPGKSPVVLGKDALK